MKVFLNLKRKNRLKKNVNIESMKKTQLRTGL
jgi:hypothetical protein